MYKPDCSASSCWHHAYVLADTQRALVIRNFQLEVCRIEVRENALRIEFTNYCLTFSIADSRPIYFCRFTVCSNADSFRSRLLKFVVAIDAVLCHSGRSRSIENDLIHYNAVFVRGRQTKTTEIVNAVASELYRYPFRLDLIQIIRAKFKEKPSRVLGASNLGDR